MLLASCQEFWGIRNIDSYVCCYDEIQSLNAVGCGVADTLYFDLCTFGATAASRSDMGGHRLSSRGRLYDSLRRVNGDIGYKKAFPTTHDHMGVVDAVMDYITGINITADKDWDASHPAGSSLNDLFSFYSRSLLPFFSSGYSYDCYPDQSNLKFRPLTDACEDDFKALVVFPEGGDRDQIRLRTVLPEGFEGCRINIEVTTARSGSFSDSEYIPALK